MLHTWPEESYLKIDLLTCVKREKSQIEAEINEIFEAKSVKVFNIEKPIGLISK
ncbi:MAG: hypothetical protein UY33_C0003G0014 [Candidatus Amesbacteria bacterium GW2011_GWA1_48_9]|uniref:S-adenosylmethionine decarboxylase proenzyme n=1 Tax=Candidatus Amesbacteria bacterium GW2011_GWA1_48_9 TaxID=1618355 RepID=A0A0G1V3A6_9BACT|nr:MAG: hypothetical protein UY33_C0003G0014 [Candidatus Amesbacteria bacterium GW2011_GWA1_48_9]